jgi:hypothetical protein
MVRPAHFIAAHLPARATTSLGHLPVAHDSVDRDAHDGRRFLHRQAAKESQFDHLALAFVRRCECLEGIVERDEIATWLGRNGDVPIERHFHCAAATLLVEVSAGVINQNPAPQARGDRQKVCAVPPVELAERRAAGPPR